MSAVQFHMGFLTSLLQSLRERRGTDMRYLCRHLLSERGEASQTALAQEIINTYRKMNAAQRVAFFEMLCREFSPDEATVLRAAADYEREPGTKTLEALSAAVEPPRQELIRRINTAPEERKPLSFCENICSTYRATARILTSSTST